MRDDKGDSGTRGGLRDILPRIESPAELETRVRHTLATRGLISVHENRRPLWAARVGLIAAGFLLGVLVRESPKSTRPAEVGGKTGRYALLLYGVPPEDTGAVHAARAKEYGAWASALANGTRWVGGQELAGVVAALGSADTPHDARNQVAGFFIIEAASRERAVEVARTCPHLKYGGRVVVMAVAV